MAPVATLSPVRFDAPSNVRAGDEGIFGVTPDATSWRFQLVVKGISAGPENRRPKTITG
jgi:hypothetical protein